MFKPEITPLPIHNQLRDTTRVYVKRTEVQRMAAARKRRQFVERAT